ncbi:MAG TPA: potassium channel family protein [Candidatus Peribacteraceae bacterium]|nr:potassium channel family protein [Candidatus Peribacteraceae bacterium]
MTKKHLAFLEQLSDATYSELSLMWLMVNVVCAVMYFALATIHSPSSPTLLPDMDTASRLYNSFYFSFITGTSVGYGDITPQGFSKVLAIGQAILSLLIFAIFVTKLVSRRQEIALHEVHRMTSEGIFYNIRQGLFLVRKDFDILIHEVEEQHVLDEQDWEILTTAYLQAQNLIEDIPNLYNGQGHDLYLIDVKREALLFEAIRRTIKRVDRLLLIMQKHGIDWHAHRESMHELKVLMQIIDTITPLWRERSPYQNMNSFEDITSVSKHLHDRIKRTVKDEVME